MYLLLFCFHFNTLTPCVHHYDLECRCLASRLSRYCCMAIFDTVAGLNHKKCVYANMLTNIVANVCSMSFTHIFVIFY